MFDSRFIYRTGTKREEKFVIVLPRLPSSETNENQNHAFFVSVCLSVD